MVKSCAAYGCTNRFCKGSSFHKFPLKDKTLLKQWITALKRYKFVPNDNSCLCNTNFLPSDYNCEDANKPRLLPSAVPSVFTFPDHLQKKNRSKTTHETKYRWC